MGANRHRAYPYTGSLILPVIIWPLTVVTFIASCVFIFSLFFTGNKDIGLYFGISLGIFLLSLMVHFIYSQKVRCPLCHGKPLIQQRCHKHKKAHKYPGLSFRTSTILDMLLRGWFRCMYCGTGFRLKK